MISKLRHWLESKPQHLRGLRILRISIALLILYRVATECRYAAYLWGSNGIGEGTTQYIYGRTIGQYFDYLMQSRYGIYIVLLMLLFGALGFLFNRLVFLSNIVLLVCFWSLEQRSFFTIDGGDVLTRLLLVFLLFTADEKRLHTPDWMRDWIHNLAVVTIFLQTVVIYTVSGLLKAHGEKWLYGVALYHISQVDWFSLPETRFIFKITLLATLLCYGTIIYQIYFPIVLFTKIKMIWIAIGILLHVSIAYTMGLITFSLVMIGLELFLINDKEYDHLKQYILNQKNRFRIPFQKRI